MTDDAYEARGPDRQLPGREVAGARTTMDVAGEDGMKIAVVTDDGQTFSRHFGRASAYAVVTVREVVVVSRELREKAAPHMPRDGPHDDGAAQGKHREMLRAIEDCVAMIAGGMGRGAYDHAHAAGIRSVVTSMRDIDQAAIAYAAGVDETERLH